MLAMTAPHRTLPCIAGLLLTRAKSLGMAHHAWPSAPSRSVQGETVIVGRVGCRVRQVKSTAPSHIKDWHHPHLCLGACRLGPSYHPPICTGESHSHKFSFPHALSNISCLHMNALRRLLPSLFAMPPRHSYGPAATGDSIDEEDQPFISGELSEKQVTLQGTTTFNRVMGCVNIILALLLAVCLTLLAVSETHNRKDATIDSLPYCEYSATAPAWH